MSRNPSKSESTAAEECRETYERMARDRQQAGREIPARAIYTTGDRDTDDWIKQSVESSQGIMRKSRSKSFLMPGLPFLRKDKSA